MTAALVIPAAVSTPKCCGCGRFCTLLATRGSRKDGVSGRTKMVEKRCAEKPPDE